MASWTQNPKKIGLEAIKKWTKKLTPLGTLKNWFWEDFGRQNGCPRGAPEIGFGGIFWSWAGLGGQDGPGWPQDPSRVLPRLIFLDFGAQLGGFWNPTWWIFLDFETRLGGFWSSTWWILGPNLVDFKLLGLIFSKILLLKRCVRPQGCVAVCRRHLDKYIYIYIYILFNISYLYNWYVFI